jgi:hypothetical protein
MSYAPNGATEIEEEEKEGGGGGLISRNINKTRGKISFRVWFLHFLEAE